MADPPASSSAPSSPAASTHDHIHSFNTGATAGGAAAAILCILVIMVLMTFRRRWQKNAASLVPKPLAMTSSLPGSHNRIAFLHTFRGKSNAEDRKAKAGDSRSIESNAPRERRPSDASRDAIEEIRTSLVEVTATGSENPVVGGRALGFTNLTVPEMVRVLNDRLRQGDVVWDEEEAPPIYGQSAYAHSETDR